MDLPYVLANLASLTGLPVRKREDGYLLNTRYSVVSFPFDPFSLHMDKAMTDASASVSFFFTKDSFYYGILKKGREAIVIGPVSQVPYSPSRLRDVLFRSGVSNNDIPGFIQGFSALPTYPLLARGRILLRVNYIWSGEKLTLSDVLIKEENQNRILDDLVKQKEEKVEKSVFPHNTYFRERKLLSYIKDGDIAALHRLFQSERPVRAGTMAQSPIRQRKNTIIVTISLVSRACIEGGMGVEEARSLSDSYLQQCERRNSIPELQNLNYHRIMDYAQKRSEIKGTDKYSATIRKAIAFVQHNVNKKITAREVAEEVYLSPNRLEIRFKEETGITLHDFRREKKREEAKRLLLSTRQTIEEISIYLCFSSPSYFQNVFKKEFGLTPRQFRENGLKGAG